VIVIGLLGGILNPCCSTLERWHTVRDKWRVPNTGALLNLTFDAGSCHFSVNRECDTAI